MSKKITFNFTGYSTICFLSWLDFDSNGFAGEVYSYTGLEKEIVGIKYKDKIYDLEPGEHKGPGSEYIYFEKFDDTFEQSYDIGDKISELNW